ncbi:hypothetical protein [Pseudanabaena sp. PCC 6802]|uniref:hypothetical protein n=1 Tax=Pseudanabaena sp. PCC 6802 TaxID=118173 RepID=UPI0003697BB5|nr:hypothetical protein [Pseudanabaena sp. PCC 6802]
MGAATRYLCRGRLEGGERIFLWETNDRDRVVVDEAGDVVSFATEAEALEARATSAGISSEPSAFYDFDAIQAWCHSRNQAVDCPAVLNIWNLLNDVPGVQELFSAAESRAAEIYGKLFHGCNLPAMGASPCEYVPEWTSAEILDLKRLILLGLNDFRMRCKSW